MNPNSNNKIERCPWAKTELSIPYHDTEWGVPVHDEIKHYEFLVLEGAQAGLSWETILRKREAYREAFDGFDPVRVARFNARRIAGLLKNAGIVRNRLKIASAVNNAKMFLKVQDEFGGFDSFIWQFVGGKPKHNSWKHIKQLPAKTAESEAMSNELLRRGFKFVGPTICYAHMQAVGMVNDHLVTCHRHAVLKHGH
jgi:DNA-3-methyladenine glycosylase I